MLIVIRSLSLWLAKSFKNIYSVLSKRRQLLFKLSYDAGNFVTATNRIVTEILEPVGIHIAYQLVEK